VIAQVAITGEDLNLLEVAHLEPITFLEQIDQQCSVLQGATCECSP
jgi:hypothetical protein